MALNPNAFVDGVMNRFSLHIEPPSYYLSFTEFFFFKNEVLSVYLFLSHAYTSIALDTRLLAQPYQPIQVELSSPAIQNSCRGLIRGPIFSCPALPRS